MISDIRLLAALLRPHGRLVVAERFIAPAGLSAIAIPRPPLDLARPVRVILFHPQTGALHSTVLDPAPAEELALHFPPFVNSGEANFVLLLFQPVRVGAVKGWQKRLATMATARRPPITLRCTGRAGAMPVHGAILASWREDGGCYAAGWLDSAGSRLTSLVAGQAAARLAPAMDGRNCFSLFVPNFSGEVLALHAETDAAVTALSLSLPPAPVPPAGLPAEKIARKGAAFARFVSELNQPGREVLEIGARLVGSRSEPLHGRFPNAQRYVGMDVHPGPTVDVVGDAHFLGHLFRPAAFDGIFSAAVLEHLAMPWIVAAEINRVLRPGGLTYHITPQAWPLHEEPNDFFRFSEEALKLLFGEPFGFDVLESGLADEVRMYPLDKEKGDLGLPLGFGYGSAWVLARKVREVDSLAPSSLTDLGRRYPA